MGGVSKHEKEQIEEIICNEDIDISLDDAIIIFIGLKNKGQVQNPSEMIPTLEKITTGKNNIRDELVEEQGILVEHIPDNVLPDRLR